MRMASPSPTGFDGELPYSPTDWHLQREAHYTRVDEWIQPHLWRKARGQKHPIEDFLFDYYPFSPGRLRLWNPGPFAQLSDYRDDTALPIGFNVNAEHTAAFTWAELSAQHQQRLSQEVSWVHRLLTGTRSRTASFGCFGLHEWAMLLGQSPEERRHAQWALRVSDDILRATIDELGLRCTHFDAWRFFTPESLLRNPWTHSRATQPDHDQGGCLHANMDLYKWSMRLHPLVPSSFIVKCFDLALRIRQLDMAASPYDFNHLGVIPVCIELPAGRADYAKQQRAFAAEADELRAELLGQLDRILSRLPELAATIPA